MFLTKIKIAATFLLIVAVISGGAGIVTYQKLAAQAPNQQETGKQKVVALAQPKAIEQKAEVVDPEAILKQKLEMAPDAIMTPDDDLKKMLEAANVDQKMKTLLWDRVEAAKKVVNGRCKEFFVGRGTLDIYLNSSRRLLEAELELSSSKADHVAAWDTHRQRMQAVYEINLERYNAGRLPFQDLEDSNYYRLDAEIGLERAKARVK
jgi:hypothetical protein